MYKFLFAKKNTYIDAHNAHIQYEGRIGVNNPGVSEIYRAGSSVKIKFNGTGLKAILKDERGCNYFNVIIDDCIIHILKVDTVKTTYTLAFQQWPRGNPVRCRVC